MKNSSKIGLIVLAGLGLICLTKWKENHLAPVSVKEENKQVNTEDSLLEWRDLAEEQKNNLKTFLQWGTKEGIIDVADLSEKEQLHHALTFIQSEKLKQYQIPSPLKSQSNYLANLKKWGTKEGIIDVANEEKSKEKEKKKRASINKQSQLVKAKILTSKKKELAAKGKPVHSKADFTDSIKKDTKTTQISLVNNSDQVRPVTLWQINRNTSISAPLPQDVEDHLIINQSIKEQIVQPQGLAVNPINQLVYVAGQLSDNIGVYDALGTLIRTIPLTDSLFPGTVSPVDVTVDQNGTVYVIGSVSNTLYVIDLQFNVKREIAVGTRPLSIAYNPINQQLYISSIVDNEVTLVNSTNFNVTQLAVGDQPLGIAINTLTGEAYIANRRSQTLSVIGQEGGIATPIQTPNGNPTNVLFNPSQNQIVLSTSNENQLLFYEAEGFNLTRTITFEHPPFALAYHPDNQFVYVGNSEKEELTIINTENEIETSIDQFKIGSGLAIGNQEVYTSDFLSGQVSTLGYQEQSSKVEIDDELIRRARDFRVNPVSISAAKFILEGNNELNTLQLIEQRMTGLENTQTISLTSSTSPQNRNNRIEVEGLKKAIINGQNGWRFKLAPRQRLTMLLTYHQLDTYHLLPKAKDYV